MPVFNVVVTIENRAGISDPEGETILTDLILEGPNEAIQKITTGEILKFTIRKKDAKTAKKTVKKACEELRLYNPMMSKASFRIIY